MVIKARRLDGWWEKSVGLIGKDKVSPIYFETRWGIHTFGVRSAIDVLILDNFNKVAVMKKNLKPNRIWLWNPKYKKVMELPGGEINKLKIKIGTRVF
jgi:uncharacterized protein